MEWGDINLKDRLVWLNWSVNGHHQGSSLHYIAKVDYTMNRLLFEREVLIQHGAGETLTAQLRVGPWNNTGMAIFEMMADRE